MTPQDIITPREYGRLEERVDSVSRDLSLMRGEIGAKILDLGEAVERSVTKQGERLGVVEKEIHGFHIERRVLVGLVLLIQAIMLAVFGAWARVWF